MDRSAARRQGHRRRARQFRPGIHPFRNLGVQDLGARLKYESGTGQPRGAGRADTNSPGQQGCLQPVDLGVGRDGIAPGRLFCATRDRLDRGFEACPTGRTQYVIGRRLAERVYIQGTAVVPPGRQNRATSERQGFRWDKS